MNSVQVPEPKAKAKATPKPKGKANAKPAVRAGSSKKRPAAAMEVHQGQIVPVLDSSPLMVSDW